MMIACLPLRPLCWLIRRLVTSFDWLDMGSLQGIEDEIRQVFAQAGGYIDRERVEAIVAAFSRRKE